jgi:hypothetical protein
MHGTTIKITVCLVTLKLILQSSSAALRQFFEQCLTVVCTFTTISFLRSEDVSPTRTPNRLPAPHLARSLSGMGGHTSGFAVALAAFQFTGASKLPRPSKSTFIKVQIP